ncbi:MAG: nitrous oxide-stimulated promoter family protein [Eubacteriales bacterium]|nr:nitrous oxide-stimulated promoter family protein [Eubacteriales bacterium]
MNRCYKKSRLSWEKDVVRDLVAIYCRGQKHVAPSNSLFCSDCSTLLNYAHQKLDSCPFGEQKIFCGNCRVHCYEPSQREAIRQVMRYAGPRLIFKNPVAALRHLIG